MISKLLNLHDFAAKLESYRDTLKELNEITEAEIERVSSLRIKLPDNESEDKSHSADEAAEFINKQMCAYLDKIETLVSLIPDYSVQGCFSTDELEFLQRRALARLRREGFPRNAAE